MSDLGVQVRGAAVRFERLVLALDGSGDVVEVREELDDVYQMSGLWRGPGSGTVEYVGCEVLIAGGGPTIWLRTRDRVFVGSWGSEMVEVPASEAVCGYYDGFFE